jgi:tetratricopeptide (TPR) repeat protein/tRNA A-37 threonylcarbamoyl transferase component Bud32
MSQSPPKHAGGDLPEEAPRPDSTTLPGTADGAAVVPENPASEPTLDLKSPTAVRTTPAEMPTLGFLGQATADPPETVHRRFGDYELLEEIARGGMGVVYKARQLRLHRLVALKMILGGQMATPKDVQRFRTEADEAASLDHPNIVPIYEVGEHDGQYYFTMKFMEGGTLSQHLARLTTDTRAAVRLLATVANAVHHAHQHGILHRDLKPGNILLDADGQPHVTDFGLAKRIEGNSALTQTGAIVGTPSYMAPEQAGGNKTLTTAVDIYSLGAVLFELLTGRPPFQAETPMETAMQVVQNEPPRPRQLNPRVPRDLETICLKCLEKDAQRRYGSADALARDLERWLTDEPIRARPTSVTERLVKWAKRRPAGAALVGVLLLAGVGIVLGGIVHNVSLQGALAQAEKERQRAEDNAAEARRHQAEAAANFQKARDAVDDMLTRVAEGRLANLSRMESVRLELLQEALKFYQGFLEQKSDDPIIRQETGRAHRRVADVCRIATRSQQSEAEYREAIAIQDTLAAQFPDHGDYRHDVAITEANLAVLLKGLGRSPEAQEHYRRAVALHERLAAESPNVVEYRQRLAVNQNSLAVLLVAAKQVPEAEKLYGQALAVQLNLVTEFPTGADHASDAAATHHNLAKLLLERKEAAAARPHLEEACRLQREALRLKAGQPTYLTLLRSHFHDLAKVLAQQGDHAGLEQLSAQIRKDSPENPSDTYDAACYLGRAVPLLEKDVRIEEPERRRRAQADADQAMVLLQEAVKKGYRNSALVVKDADLDALRGREEFTKLLAEMDKRPPAEKSPAVAQDYRTILKDYQDAE